MSDWIECNPEELKQALRCPQSCDADVSLMDRAADRIEELEHNYASLQQAFDEMKALAAQRLAALQETERQRDELALIIATDTGTESAVAEMQRQRDELLADAERYRWLRSMAFTEDRDGGYVKNYVFPHVCYSNGADYKGHRPYYYDTLDAAIDAAIAAARKEQGE